MQNWLQGKLDGITQEFLDGASYGAIFEAMYLTYLECLVAHWLGVPVARRVWSEWGAVCTKATPDGAKVQCLSSHVTDRKELVTALQGFHRRFDVPDSRKSPTPKGDQKKPATHSSDETDLFSLLAGE